FPRNRLVSHLLVSPARTSTCDRAVHDRFAFHHILGAPVSGFILDHVHWLGVSSWRWLLILEGAPAIACGALTYFLLPGRPQEAQFLTSEEKEWIQAELGREEQQKLEHRTYSILQAL